MSGEDAKNDEVRIERPEWNRDLWSQMYWAVYDDPDMDRNGHTAYMALIRWVNFQTRRTKPISRADLAKGARVSVDTLDRGLRTCVKLGYVEVVKDFDPDTNRFGESTYLVYDERGAREARAAAAVTESESTTDRETTKPDPSRSQRPGRGSRSQRPGQTGTSPEWGSRSQRLPLAAHSGHLAAYCGSTTREENQEEEREKDLPLLAVGERTVRNARDAPTAKDQDLDSVGLAIALRLPGPYAAAPMWVRRIVGVRIAAAIAEGLSPWAIEVYAAAFADDPEYGDFEHLKVFDATMRKLADDIARGEACPGCGRDPSHPWCDAAITDETESGDVAQA